MARHMIWILFLFIQSCWPSENLPDTIVIAFLVRNKAHVLPYFLGAVENLEYPKSRISLWIRTGHNSDDSEVILRKWISDIGEFYNDVNFFSENSEGDSFFGEKSPFDWTPERMNHVISLREQALNYARKSWASFLFFLDADSIISYPETLSVLISLEKPVVAPMLWSKSMYSNFWAGMTEDGYYKRTDDYELILSREKTGVFMVPMVFGAVLMNLQKSTSLEYTYVPESLFNYEGPTDDIITFAHSVYFAGDSMFVANTHNFGAMMVPSEETMTLDDDIAQWEYVLMTSMKHGVPGFLYSYFVPPHYRPATKLGFDEVYLINLDRRDDRKVRSEALFQILGINATRLSAVDGQLIEDDYLSHAGISFLPGYKDPYYQRPMTKGEIGCFMSHYHIWEDVVDKGYKQVIVFEDDLYFIEGARQRLIDLREEIADRNLDYDLLYIGRKRLNQQEEMHSTLLPGSTRIATVGYTYWTLGYLLTLQGAKKLIDARPLETLLPVDEYLPIMYDKHPTLEWAQHFPERNLIAYTSEPLIVHPVHYRGEPGYVSDTEESPLVSGDESQRVKARMPADLPDAEPGLGDSGLRGKEEL